LVCGGVEVAVFRDTALTRSPKGDRVRAEATARVQASAVAERLLERIAQGALQERRFAVRFWDGSELPATHGASTPTVLLRDPRAAAHLLRQPNQLGLSRAWVAGTIDLDGDLDQALALRHDFDAVSLSPLDRIRTLIGAVHVAGAVVLRRPTPLESEARLVGRRRTHRRDQSAVRHHYDLPAAFYRLILGPAMVYSCAYFNTPDEPLERAQQRKLELICRKLALQPDDRLLDIGCGWGSLIIHAAVHHQTRAVGVTLSSAQAELARERIREAGVADRCEVRVSDYRDVHDGPFDAIASVGMYEHVGHDQLSRYATTVTRLLRPGGVFLNHGIARLVPGPEHDRTFISRFVFPDGELHPISDVLTALEGAGLELRDLESLREHYGLTLRRWVANLGRHREAAIRTVGEERERIWRLYMTGCAQAFECAELSVFQAVAVRPGGPHQIPLTRERLNVTDHVERSLMRRSPLTTTAPRRGQPQRRPLPVSPSPIPIRRSRDVEHPDRSAQCP
jgi:cyclopropane-fatty-acyl-phospholipid synthase